MASAFARKPTSHGLTIAAVIIAVLMLIPIFSIFAIALPGGMADITHLVETVLPRATLRTLVLMISVALVTGVTGVLTAWLVVSCEFPFRRFLSIALVLPLAMPTYLAAYAFGEFFDYTGPLQTGLRMLTGLKSAKDYWFPDIHTMPGAVFVLGSVLYPYIYLTSRSVFLMQGRAAADVARTLGANPFRVLFKIQIPMARPAIIIGLALVMMETLNDIGAVQFLGIQTLTASIYDTWLNRGSLSGAAQIACFLLAFVVILTLIERVARRRQKLPDKKQQVRSMILPASP